MMIANAARQEQITHKMIYWKFIFIQVHSNIIWKKLTVKKDYKGMDEAQEK